MFTSFALVNTSRFQCLDLASIMIQKNVKMTSRGESSPRLKGGNLERRRQKENEE